MPACVNAHSAYNVISTFLLSFNQGFLLTLLQRCYYDAPLTLFYNLSATYQQRFENVANRFHRKSFLITLYQRCNNDISLTFFQTEVQPPNYVVKVLLTGLMQRC